MSDKTNGSVIIEKQNRSCVGVLAIILTCFLLISCGTPLATPQPTFSPSPIPATLTIPPQSTDTAIPSATITPTELPADHRIAIRVVDGVGEFYDRISGEKFIPRGNNYVRLANQQSTSGEMMFYHSTFNVGLYESERAEEALLRMQVEGYNVVHVFIQGNCKTGCIGDPIGGLSDNYVANVVDFLQKAKNHDIYVILTTDAEPATPYYISMLDTTWSEDFSGTNSNILRGGGILVGKNFWRDLIEELRQQDAPMDAILAYQLREELFFESNFPPLNKTSGWVSTANGDTYNMASSEDKQRMMDEGLVYWIDTLRNEILKTDPTALVSVGFFWPQKPHPARIGDARVIETRPAIWESSADFIDLHPYPGWDLNMAEYVDNFGMAGMQEKPIIMGEFGAARTSYASEAVAARVLQDWQVESCTYGFDGWMLWTWDTEEQADFYHALSGDGQIDQALAPINRPDSCQSGSFTFFENNLALGMAAQASRSLPDQPPSGAVDGVTNRWWGAGAPAPQWILIDLGEPKIIGKIRLVVTQSPSGDTVHQIWAGPTIEHLILLYHFEGFTVDGQVLEFIPENPVENIRYIKVSTRLSPSWVGWKEIEVLAP